MRSTKLFRPGISDSPSIRHVLSKQPVIDESLASVEGIRQRAYRIWDDAGRPESDGIEFWLKAEKELQSN